MNTKYYKVALYSLSLPTAVTAFLYWTSDNSITLIQLFCAWLLLLIPWHFFYDWKEKQNTYLPFFSMLSFMYWLYFALPLFWGERVTVGIEARPLDEYSITASMVMTVVGVTMLCLGMKIGISRFLSPRRLPDVSLKQSGRNYIRLLLAMGVIAGFWESATYTFGDGGRQIITILTTLTPSVAFAILFRLHLRNESRRIDRLLIIFYLLGRAIVGLSSGWLGTLVAVAIICIAIYVTEKRALPRWVLALAVLYIAFFQVGKSSMRAKYWYDEVQAGRMEKIKFWLDASVNRWQEALDDGSGREFKSLGYEVLSRTSLLPQAANVLELTPAQVPFQYGSLYSYLPITLIPRFVWPEKPSVNDANRFYQVNYNLTLEENLSNVSISVGYLTESYISFGWVGIVAIMFLFGNFYGFFETCFLSANSGMLFQSIGIALLLPLLGIESQASVYLGGLIQQVLLTFLIFTPVMFSGRTRIFSTSLATRHT